MNTVARVIASIAVPILPVAVVIIEFLAWIRFGDWLTRNAPATAGSVQMGAGDLGGWALDLATFFASFRRSGIPASDLEDFVRLHLGARNDRHRFGAEDLFADADGWLVGRATRSGKSFSDAYREVHRERPTAASRLQAFLAQRFGSPERLEDAIHSVFRTGDFLEWFAVWAFLGRQEVPNKKELQIFAQAAAGTMYGRVIIE